MPHARQQTARLHNKDPEAGMHAYARLARHSACEHARAAVESFVPASRPALGQGTCGQAPVRRHANAVLASDGHASVQHASWLASPAEVIPGAPRPTARGWLRGDSAGILHLRCIVPECKQFTGAAPWVAAWSIFACCAAAAIIASCTYFVGRSKVGILGGGQHLSATSGVPRVASRRFMSAI